MNVRIELVGIASDLAAIFVSPLLSSQRTILIHHFDDGKGIVQRTS
jgi:hypothetical protein